MQTIRKFLRPSKARSAACSKAVSDAIKMDSQTWWLLERGQALNHSPTIWWCGDDDRINETYETHWTTNANKARKFVRYDDAWMLAKRLFGESDPLITVAAHIFLNTKG